MEGEQEDQALFAEELNPFQSLIEIENRNERFQKKEHLK